MSRRLFTLCSALSLVLCVATVVMGLWSYRRSGWTVSWAVCGQRYVVRSQAGWLGLFRPPPGSAAVSASSAAANTPDSLAAQLMSVQADWYLHREALSFVPRRAGRPVALGVSVSHAGYAYASEPRPFPLKDLVRPLLAALDRPETCARAHLVLAKWCGTDAQPTLEDGPDGTCIATVDGLRVVLRPQREYMNNRRHDTIMYVVSPEPEPGVVATVRDQWYRRLNVPLAVVHHGVLAGGTLLLPGLWGVLYLLRWRRTRLRRSRNLCVHCGYDLRASTERCPECGTPIPY